MELIPYYPTRGVNLLTDPLRLGMDEAVALKNLYPTLAGKLAKRKGMEFHALVEPPIGIDPSSLIPTNFMTPAQTPDAFVTTLRNETTTYITINKYLLPPPVIPQTAVTNVSFPTSDRRPGMCAFGKHVLVSSPVGLQGHPYSNYGCIWAATYFENHDALGFWPQVFSPGPAGIVFKDSTGKNFSPSVMGVYRGRVVYTGFEPPYENVLVFSDTGDFTTVEVAPNPSTVILNNSARTLAIPGLKGDRITAVVEIATSSVSGQVESNLFILSESSCYIMQDEPPLTTETVGRVPTFVKVQYECGCVSQETVVRTPVGVLWASWNDVWAVDYGGIPRRVGTKIRPALVQARPEHRHLWHAAYNHADGSYRLAIAASGYGELGIMHPCGQQWWLDLRNGLPRDAGEAAWFGPQEYRVACEDGVDGVRGTYMMRTIDRPGEDPIVVAPYMANCVMKSPYARSLVYAKADALDGYDRAMTQESILGAGNAPDRLNKERANAIAFEIITPRISLGDMSIDKTYEGLELTHWANDILAIGVEVIVDGGRQVDDEYVTTPQLGFALDVDPLDSTRATYEHQSITIHPDPAQRFTGKDFQLRIYDKPGYVLASEALARKVVVRLNGEDYVVDADQADTNKPLWYENVDDFIAVLGASLAQITGQPFVGSYDHKLSFSTVRGVASLNSGGVSWTWIGGDYPVWVEPKVARSSRKIGAMLGFLATQPDINSPYMYLGNNESSPNILSQVSTHFQKSAAVEIASMFIRTSFFRRRPGGKRYEPEIP